MSLESMQIHGGHVLARNNFTAKKRMKEMNRKEKQEKKRQRKLEKDTLKPDGEIEPSQVALDDD
jgi:hypothetical protein